MHGVTDFIDGKFLRLPQFSIFAKGFLLKKTADFIT